jgi:hypothetical protein
VLRRARIVVGTAAAAMLLASCVLFGPPSAVQAGAAADDRSVALGAGDVTGDGRDVLVLTRSATTTALARMTSCGDLCIQRADALTLADGAQSFTVADLDGDAIDDVVTGGDTEVRVYFGSDDGLDEADHVSLGPVRGATVVAEDFDGDGDSDVGALGGFYDPTFGADLVNYGLFRGDGDGGFDAYDSLYVENPSPRDSVVGLTTGDVDDDGRAEALVTENGFSNEVYGTIRVFGATGSERSYTTDFGAASATGDLNGDGFDDVAYVTNSPITQFKARITLLRSTPTGFTGFGAGGGLTFVEAPGQTISDVALLDADGNGKTDVVALDPDGGKLLWWNGKGDGTFTKLSNGASRFEGDAGPSPRAVLFEDLGGTALPDAVVTNSSLPSARISRLENTSR